MNLRRRVKVALAAACLGWVCGEASGDDDFSLDFNAAVAGGGLNSWGGPILINGAAGDIATTASLSGGVFTLNAGVWVNLSQVAPACEGDLNGDLNVDLQDLAVLLVNFGMVNGGPQEGDINGDGIVDLADLSLMLFSFGTLCG